MTDRLTHLDEEGRARMVNVGDKALTHRVCVAVGEVRMAPETLAKIMASEIEKGDVLATARLAGIQASKRTSEWIPLAHPLPLDAVSVDFEPGQADGLLLIRARAEAHWRTGVEMEALVAVSAAALTIYDMCKAIDRGMLIGEIGLLEKSGGKSGNWIRPQALEARDR